MPEKQTELLKQALAKGIINQSQYHEIISLAPDNPDEYKSEPKRGLNPIMTLYYFGALIIIFAFTYFLSTQWKALSAPTILSIALTFQIICFALGAYLRNKLGYKISGGLLSTVAMAITPLTAYSLLKIFGFWPEAPNTYSNQYSDYWRVIKGNWVWIEAITLIVSLIGLYLIRFSFIAIVIGHTAWFLSMDLAELILRQPHQNNYHLTMETRQWVSILIGAIMIGIGRLLNKKTKEDYSLWLFIFGGLIFTTSTSLYCLRSPLSAFCYALIHLILVITSILWQRKSLMVFGALGIYIYLGHLAWNTFKHSLLFPMALALLGLLMILLTVAFQQNKAKLATFTSFLGKK